MANKPSGVSGPFIATVTETRQVIAEQLRINWPSTQKEIERKILGYFVREFEKQGAKFLAIEDGGTRELDFLLTLPGGKVHLELMEAILPQHGEIPFQPGNRSYDPIPYGEAIFREVSKKISKYGFSHEIPIDLLIYITHEQYRPNGAAIQVLQRLFLENKHPFQYVFFLIPLAEDLTKLHVLFNKDYPFDPPAFSELKDRSWINLVSSEFQLIQSTVTPSIAKD